LAAAAAVAAFASWSGLATAGPSLPGAKVTVTGVTRTFEASGVSDETGARITPDLPPGAYRLTVSLDVSDPKIRAQAADVDVEVDVAGRQVSCSRANLSTGAPYSTAILVDAGADQPVVVHLSPKTPAQAQSANAPARRGIDD
jgi:hypothetical protein